MDLSKQGEMLDLLKEMCFRQDIIEKVLKIAKSEEEAVNLALEFQENPSLLSQQPKLVMVQPPSKSVKVEKQQNKIEQEDKSKTIDKVSSKKSDIEESKTEKKEELKMVKIIR